MFFNRTQRNDFNFRNGGKSMLKHKKNPLEADMCQKRKSNVSVDASLNCLKEGNPVAY